MPKTVVGLFENPGLVDDVMRDIEAHGFPRREVRRLEEPATFNVTGVMSFPRLDFENELTRELNRIGATGAQSKACLDGLRRGGALVFATAADESVKTAAAIMNRHGAVKIAETSGPEPYLPHVARERPASADDSAGHSVVFSW